MQSKFLSRKDDDTEAKDCKQAFPLTQVIIAAWNEEEGIGLRACPEPYRDG